LIMTDDIWCSKFSTDVISDSSMDKGLCAGLGVFRAGDDRP
jgi:hypothetical protein